MTQPRLTAAQRLADVLLHGRLVVYLAERRASGKSWRQMALDLRDEVGLDVTPETLRSWHVQLVQTVQTRAVAS